MYDVSFGGLVELQKSRTKQEISDISRPNLDFVEMFFFIEGR